MPQQTPAQLNVLSLLALIAKYGAVLVHYLVAILNVVNKVVPADPDQPVAP